jgi:hypothetical protein
VRDGRSQISFRGLRLRVLLELRQDFFGEKLHRLAFPRFVRACPVKTRHQQSAKWADLFAEGDELVEQRFWLTVETAAFCDHLDCGFVVRHFGPRLQ